MINEGYKILELYQTSKPGECIRGYAIGQAVGTKTPCQWVTWRYIDAEDSGTPDFYSGNYWSAEWKARQDFYQRISDSFTRYTVFRV